MPGVIFSLLLRIPAALWLALALALCALNSSRTSDASAARAALATARAASSEAALVTALTQSGQLQKINDDLQRTTTERSAALRASTERMRSRASAELGSPSAATTAACRSYDGPAADLIRAEVGAAALELAAEADAVTAQLVACQAYVRAVAGPLETD